MTRLVAAIDLGGTRCKAALVAVEPSGRRPSIVTSLEPVAVHGLDGDAALDVVASLIARLPTAGAVGLAVPGLHDRGVVASLPGKFPGLEGQDVRQALGTRTGLVVQSANDALAAAVGEAVAGSLEAARCGVMVTIGTGVGTAVVHDGAPLGNGPQAGGFLGGQIQISDPTGPTDTSGQRGTIEARCCAQQILAEAVNTGCEARTVEEVVQLAAAGDAAALAGIQTWRGWLVRALAALAHAHGPEILSVGGGPIGDGRLLLDGVHEQLQANVWPGYAPVVVPAALGDQAALIGIAHMTRPEIDG